jgi:uncharacterized protein (DUF2236 family)
MHGEQANEHATTTGDPARRRPVRRATSADHAGLPIGPGSITWQIAGDSRALLLIGRTGVLQNMHPAVSQALLDHSHYFADPIGRIGRSIPQILGVIYDDEGDAVGVRVRDWHRPIRSAPDASERYRALDPSVFYWTHATFVEAAIETQRRFGTPLTGAECEQYFRESITWWSRYGMSMAPVPTSYAAFRTYWQDMFASVLAATPVARDAVERSALPVPPPRVPPALWRWGGERVAVSSATWITVATLPPEARAILGLRWTPTDERKAAAYQLAVRAAWRGVPSRARRLAVAAAADRRVTQRAAAHAAARD